MTRSSLHPVSIAALVIASTPAAASGTPAVSQGLQPGVTSPAAGLATAAGVDRYYQAQGTSSIWFRPGAGAAAAEKLAAILRRAALDGLADGPVLAMQVESAALLAANGNSAQVAYAEKLLSQIWTHYVQALHAPASAMTYGDPARFPQPPRPERILFEAARAPLLAQHLESVSGVNPLYAELRNAAWADLQASAALPDQRLMDNLARIRAVHATDRYIVVDVATARLWMFEQGQLADSMKVIVGKSSEPTPLIASTIHYATFNPYWNVPSDVVKRVVAPAVLKQGKSYLAKQRYEIVSDWTDDATVVAPAQVDWKAVAAGRSEVRVRQLPGNGNMMGRYKFGFANDLGIYLHDTPNKGLFDHGERTFSLGCVRVEDAQRLARWLLGRDPIAPSNLPEQHVALPQGVPIYLTYLTAQVDSGRLSYAKDIYGLDARATPTQVASAE